VNEAIKTRQRKKEEGGKKTQGFRFSLNVAFNFYLFQNEPIQRGEKKKSELQFAEAEPGNTSQSEGTERHADSFRRSRRCDQLQLPTHICQRVSPSLFPKQTKNSRANCALPYSVPSHLEKEGASFVNNYIDIYILKNL